MNWWSVKLEEAGLCLNVHPAEDERLDAANEQIRNLIFAVAQRQAALKAAREALEWYNAGAFEVGGVPVCDWISDALDAGIRS